MEAELHLGLYFEIFYNHIFEVSKNLKKNPGCRQCCTLLTCKISIQNNSYSRQRKITKSDKFGRV